VLALVVSFLVIMIKESGQGAPQRGFAEQISFDKHSSFADRTHLSA